MAKEAKEAEEAMGFDEVVQRHFAGSAPEAGFVRRAAVTLIQKHGFSPANTLACVGHCRDELCQSLSREVESMWGKVFDLGSLAGSLTLGKSGFIAARTHAPIVGGRCRYLFFVFPHIGIGAGGELGVARRPGQRQETPACGALAALQSRWKPGRRREPVDWQDPEMSLLKMRLERVPGLGEAPSLLDLTMAMHRVTLEDLERLVESAFDLERDDLAVVAGVQIHTPAGGNLIWPGASYFVVQGVRSEFWV